MLYVTNRYIANCYSNILIELCVLFVKLFEMEHHNYLDELHTEFMFRFARMIFVEVMDFVASGAFMLFWHIYFFYSL